MRGRGRGRGFYNPRMGMSTERIGYNQCALCKQEGHWKNECPSGGGSSCLQEILLQDPT